MVGEGESFPVLELLRSRDEHVERDGEPALRPSQFYLEMDPCCCCRVLWQAIKHHMRASDSLLVNRTTTRVRLATTSAATSPVFLMT